MCNYIFKVLCTFRLLKYALYISEGLSMGVFLKDFDSKSADIHQNR